ncbi:heme-binding protein [Pusillimonas sp.]|uniref:heme-binding protein n=1 Tax=Pusillimonas sp. TaxID=3040095 RepID=UPI0037CA139A
MSQLSSQQALTLIGAAFKAARKENYKPMGVVVVDAAGQVVASAREDGATALRLDIALGKTGASIGMGVNSRALVQRAADMPVFFTAISASAQQKFIPQTGAVLILDEQGTIVGAAGASGGTGDQDEEIVMAGIAAAGLKHS